MKKPEIKEYLNAINYNKNPLMDYEITGEQANVYEKHYPAFIVNKILSSFSDCILFVNEINRYSLGNKEQFDFLRLSLKKSKRFSPWQNSQKNEDINVICEYYNVNKQRAIEYLKILNEDELSNIKKIIDKGGI